MLRIFISLFLKLLKLYSSRESTFACCNFILMNLTMCFVLSSFNDKFELSKLITDLDEFLDIAIIF